MRACFDRQSTQQACAAQSEVSRVGEAKCVLEMKEGCGRGNPSMNV